ncbi:MAG TPA: RES family NAD+ phosphorylase [Casimicrobiaceae bacterium]|nr:RES family NAD+ phosphorylase [Casimicrobiaceae bacterium]
MSTVASRDADARTRRVQWRPAYRLVPSRFPPVGLFDRVVRPEDLEAVYAIEALTNDRVRQETGNLALVAVAERISGPGTTPIMAAFTHLNPEGSRFSDGSFGVWYCSDDLDTALAEVRFHQERFLRRTQEGPIRLEMRLYLVDLDARLVDARARDEVHLPSDYGPSQKVGIAARVAGRDGVLYRSVRNPGGLCAAVFRPRVLARCRQSRHYALHYDGERIVAVTEMKSVWEASSRNNDRP